MATKIVKTLEFPGSSDGYQINAVALEGKTLDDIRSEFPTASSLGLSGAMKFLGTTTTNISDGSTTKTISVNGSSITVTNGNVVLYGGYEYVWTGTSWEQLGQEGSFKVVQTAVSSPSASGSSYQFIDTISQNTQGVITATKKSVREASTSQSGLMTSAMVTQLNNVSSKVSSLTTDDLDGGEETWYFDCGTSTTVLD